MCYWVLTVSGKVVSRTSVQYVTRSKMPDPAMLERKKGFDKALEERLDGTNFTNEEAGDMCINDIDNTEKAAHGNGSNTPSDYEYADMLP